MAKVMKAMKDVAVGDVQVVVRKVVEKHETVTGWVLLWDDGKKEQFEKAAAPAIETGQ